MRQIQSRIDVTAGEYRENYVAMTRRLKEFHAHQHAARYERPRRDLDRLARQNKLSVRERLELLLDPGTPFLEFSTLAACRAYDRTVPGAGVVTGIGIVQGREVAIHANDASVKGGAWYPLTVKKIVRLLDIAIENRLPVVHICDSAGGFLPLQHGVFPDRYLGGRVFRNQTILSRMNVPQLAIVGGHCTAGGAYVPALSDYNIIIEGSGAIFLGGPPLVKAATGEEVGVQELGGAIMHTSVSGTGDYRAASETHAFALAREVVSQWKQPQKAVIATAPIEEPFYDPRELYGIIPKDRKTQFDMREVIARIVDGSRFHEYQPDYGTSLVCGFAHIWGFKVGILANNGVLFNDSSLKAAHFIQLCNQNRTPLVFFQNITGFMVGRQYEERGITKDGAKMLMAQGGSAVPKFTVIANASYGAGNYGMCGRAWDGRTLFMWPQAEIGVMGAEQAANTMADVKIRQLQREGKELTDAEIAAIRDPVLERYKRDVEAYTSTSEIWDDGILDPVDTRNALAISISAALNAPIGDPHYGVFRM
ncbi:acyl-CoA carboxylase subunit beta [Ferrovibrio sp.]|uniref:acyl-CoA carboxylase subunit beta n=1 Tax=Ferrovibrio sp. TaxID=1917215 RepID=UPI001BBCD58E|nr:carboxyl transferase domain-containing protein [Ferrovibrio sp.]MBS4046012.1 methylcrotonoyl-CoA carboxylase [Alphaproteobacteria bacterium]